MAFPITAILAAIPTLFSALSSKGKWYDKAISLLQAFLNKPGASKEEIERDLMKIDAEKFIALKQMEHDFRMQVMKEKHEINKAYLDLAKVQGEINKEDAKSMDKYRARWRPTVGWLCTYALGLQIVVAGLIMPLVAILGLFINFGANFSEVMHILKTVDLAFAITILIPLLGIGGYRTVEKIKQVKKADHTDLKAKIKDLEDAIKEKDEAISVLENWKKEDG